MVKLCTFYNLLESAHSSDFLYARIHAISNGTMETLLGQQYITLQCLIEQEANLRKGTAAEPTPKHTTVKELTCQGQTHPKEPFASICVWVHCPPQLVQILVNMMLVSEGMEGGFSRRFRDEIFVALTMVCMQQEGYGILFLFHDWLDL